MKRIVIAALMVVLTGATAPFSAADSIVQSVAKGCEKELTELCTGVTPGEGRVLACLYAYQDQLSGRCEYALYDAAAQLERFVGALTYLANECSTDLRSHCGDVAVGQGRVAKCLLGNKAKLQQRCVAAIDATGLKVE
jgi:hypothetical protein